MSGVHLVGVDPGLEADGALRLRGRELKDCAAGRRIDRRLAGRLLLKDEDAGGLGPVASKDT